MKPMLLGIFLMLCSIWCLIFRVVGNTGIFATMSLPLALAAAGCFIGGFAEKTPKERDLEN